MFFKLLYYYRYTGISRAKKFNLIIFNNIKRDFFINLNRFKAVKNVIILNFINKRTIKIVLNRAIIISFIILRFEIIMKRKKIEFFSLL